MGTQSVLSSITTSAREWKRGSSRRRVRILPRWRRTTRRSASRRRKVRARRKGTVTSSESLFANSEDRFSPYDPFAPLGCIRPENLRGRTLNRQLLAEFLSSYLACASCSIFLHEVLV